MKLQVTTDIIEVAKKDRAAIHSITDSGLVDLKHIVLKTSAENNSTLLMMYDRNFYTDINTCFEAKEDSITLNNTIQWAICDAQTAPRKIVIGNWSIVNNAKEDFYTKQEYFSVGYNRLLSFVEKYNPDTIVLCGLHIFNYVMTKHLPDVKGNWYYRFNRVYKIKIGDRAIKIIGTLDTFRIMWSENPKIITHASMLGFLARGISVAFKGSNEVVINFDRKKIKCVYVDTIEKFNKFYRKLIKEPIVAIDTETSSLYRIANKLLSIQFSFDKNKGYFIPVEHFDSPFNADEIRHIKTKLKKYFEFGKSKLHIYHYAKFDLAIIHSQLNVKYYNHSIWDTQNGQFALDENSKFLNNMYKDKIKAYSLDFLLEQFGCDIYSNIAFSKQDRANIAKLKIDKSIIEYGVYDVVVLQHLARAQYALATSRGNENFKKFVVNQLGDTIIAIVQMEQAGMGVDMQYLFSMKSKSGPLQKLIDSYIEELYKLDSVIKVNNKLMRRANMNVSKTLFGKNPWLFKYNDNSHQQILFFEQLGLDPVSNKKDGTGKIDKSFLKKYSDVKEVSIFGELRKVKTLYNSFISSLFDILKNDPDCRGDLRLRSNYSPLTVLTSRLSSTDPNLQNIPAHGKQAHLVQRLIIPSLGNMFLKADFMAHEVRDWGNQSGDHAIANNFYKSLKLRQQLRYLCYNNPDEAIMWRKLKDSKEWFKITDPKQKEAILSSINNEATAKIAKIDFLLELYGDIHKLNVNIFYGTPVLEVSKEQRQNIKSVVFGTLYGKGAASLARDLKIEEQEAQEIIDTMFEKFSKGKEWIDKMHSNGAMDCFITSPLGMRRHLWGYLSSSYKVIGAMNRRGPNSAIQGAASNMGCAAVRELQSLIWKYFESNKFSLGGRSVINYVHDSLESEVKIDTMPIYVYLKEHALTTLVHRKMADIFDYNLLVGLETEFGFGPTMAHIEKWDYMADSLLHNIESTIKFQIDELKYKLPSNKILKVVEHNWNVVAKIRMKELKVSMKDKSPNRYMYLLDEGIKNPVEELDLRCI